MVKLPPQTTEDLDAGLVVESSPLGSSQLDRLATLSTYKHKLTSTKHIPNH